MKKHISATAFAGLLALAGCSKVPTGSAEAAGNPGALGVRREIHSGVNDSRRNKLPRSLTRNARHTAKSRGGQIHGGTRRAVSGWRPCCGPQGHELQRAHCHFEVLRTIQEPCRAGIEVGFLRYGWPNLRDPEQQLFPGKRGAQETSLPLDWRGIGWRSNDWSNCRRWYRSADRRGCGRGSWNRGLGDYRQTAG